MSRHIPGNPTIIPQNMPGAGSLKAANYVFSVGRRTEPSSAHLRARLASPQLIGHATFDTRQFTWIGSITEDTSLCVSWKTSPVKTWNDVMAKQFTVGGEGPTPDPDIFAKLYKNMFGAKMRLARGFPGTSNIALAHAARRSARGVRFVVEHDQVAASGLDQGQENQSADAGRTREGPGAADVPMASDLARTEEQQQILEALPHRRRRSRARSWRRRAFPRIARPRCSPRLTRR